MDKDLENLKELSQEKLAENKKYFQKLKKRTPKRLDLIVQEIHEEEFERTDCLNCGNCCKTTSPMFTYKDIERISKHLKMKVSAFVSQYLRIDEDDFHVLQTSPCPFLDLNDNSCFIYNVRPKACAEYPHTNRKKFIQLANLTIKNTEICPATYRIIEELKKKLPIS
ncbi:zinc/iron-chelating domain-containing protein [Tenacibaculum sp. SZ-18]|uniref:YkgJ family cysteine cluster protein n=1 Tax=Tenacibaculum sp. SZ-18 TaxID=754423 RepID=UPI000C2D5E76|nr:YkgJ family cysteine cluster protein [Tenacibaculum sp. SZ-18]AUC14681.1 zinc/iron-chelating domain-containing protein [Tenacibaculum sp. SZ-18]